MKKISLIKLALMMMFSFMLFACGGGNPNASLPSNGNGSTAIKTPVYIDTISWKVEIEPVMDGCKMVNLVENNPTEVVLDADNKVIPGYRLVWNDGDSWYPNAGVIGVLTLPKTILTNATKKSGAGMPYLVKPDGKFVAFNTQKCRFYVNGVETPVGSDGLLHYQALTSPPDITPPPGPVAFPSTPVYIDTITWKVEIAPVMDGCKMVNLVESNPTEVVLDVDNKVIPGYRLVWNDGDSWYPNGAAIGSLTLPKTTLTNATKKNGAGMPYLVKPDGNFVAFNTQKCIFFINGVETAIGADGLLHYTAVTSPPPPALPPGPAITPATPINLNTNTWQVEIAPVMEGRNLVNLIDNNPAETVLDASLKVIPGYRLVWNDADSWYPNAGAIGSLTLPKTLLPNATKKNGAGMPYLVRPNGTFIAFNTHKCRFYVNGVETPVGSDGLLHYQALTSPPAPTPPPAPLTPKNKVYMSNGSLQMQFAIVDGYIIDLVKGGVARLKTSDVQRVFWNGDLAQWSLSNDAPYSCVLKLPVTGLEVPAHDNGIIRIVDVRGEVYSINTTMAELGTGITLTTDGRQLFKLP